MVRVVTATLALDMQARLDTAAAPNMDTVVILRSTAVMSVRRVMALAFKLFLGFDEFWRGEG